MTPPVVGFVMTEMNRPPASRSLPIAAEVFAICIRDSIPSCILAPPEAEKITSGSFFFVAYSAALVTFSPTAMPMLAIINLESMTQITALCPSILQVPVTTASGISVFFSTSESLSSYSGKSSGLYPFIHLPNSLKLSSSQMYLMRTLAAIFLYFPHSGHSYRLSLHSFFGA